MSGIKSTFKFDKNYKYNIKCIEKVHVMELTHQKYSKLGSFLKNKKIFFFFTSLSRFNLVWSNLWTGILGWGGRQKFQSVENQVSEYLS